MQEKFEFEMQFNTPKMCEYRQGLIPGNELSSGKSFPLSSTTCLPQIFIHKLEHIEHRLLVMLILFL